jgi:signal peptide peptidase SppA
MNQPSLFESISLSMNSLWAITPDAYERLRETMARIPPDGLASATIVSAASTTNSGYQNSEGVAVIPFNGVVSKNRTLMGRIFGGQAVTTEAGAPVHPAGADYTVKSKHLVIDSPGGTVDGTSDLAGAVASANAVKPVTAYASDTAASAAYWIGSQAGRFVGNSTAAVGSIGVFAAIPDISRMAKNIGIDMNIVKSASAKGAGTMGAPVTDAQLSEVQRTVDAIHGQFVGAVSRGRGRDMSAVADGRIHIGQAAVDIGLLDAIEPLSTTLEVMQIAARPKATMMEEAPVAETPTPVLEAVAETPTPVIVAPAPAPAPDHSADIAGLKAELAALKEDQEISSLLEKAKAERRLTPALTDTAKLVANSGGLDALKSFLAALPASAPAGGSIVEEKAEAVPTRAPGDHVGVAMHAYKSDTAPVHMAAIAYMEKNKVSYMDAVIATTRK